MPVQIEFRSRTSQDQRWELRPVIHTHAIESRSLTEKGVKMLATRAAQALADDLKLEVAWNFTGGTTYRSVAPKGL